MLCYRFCLHPNSGQTVASRPKLNDETIYLVDGSGYIFRAYFAIRGLRSKSGVPTNAVYGFTNMLLKLIKEHQPKYLAIAFDRREPTFRHKLYPAYKANRPAPPEDLIPQFPLIHEVVETFNIKNVTMAGYEADDVIGTLVHQARACGREVVVVTGDKDLMQLVDSQTYLLDELRAAKVGVEEFIDADGVKNEMGVWPHQVIDFLAIAGDSSDNIPGIAGLGKKTAVELLNEYETLENIFANAEKIKQNARREKLLAGRELAFLSKQLVSLDNHVPLNVTLDDLKYTGMNYQASQALFQRLDFNRLLKDEGKPPVKPEPAVPAPTLTVEHRIITTAKELAALVPHLKKAHALGLYVESLGTDSMTAHLLGLAIAWGKDMAVYIPLGHSSHQVKSELTLPQLQAALDPILADKIVVAHNAKLVEKILTRHGFKPFAIGGDPMLQSYLLDQDQSKHGLPELSESYLPLEPPMSAGLPSKQVNQDLFSRVPFDELATLAAARASRTLALEEAMKEKLKSESLADLYVSLELPLEEVLSRIELSGVKIDTAVLHQLENEMSERMAQLETQAFEAAGQRFNMASPKQISAILFDQLQLTPPKKIKTGFSTDAATLEKIKDQHALPRIMLEHRMCAKLINTYLSVLPKLINESTGRLHTTFNQFVTATGRLSSSDPNLQNIPIRTPEGRRIRKAFIAEPGFSLISLDYSQVELRLLAVASGDAVLLDSFAKDQDVHTRTASEIFDVDPSMVTAAQRGAAKTINFGLLYGMGPKRLSDTLGVSFSEANKYLTKYFQKYAGILDWKNRVLEEAKVTHSVRTLFGRKRAVPELQSSNAVVRNRGERLAINTPIQGTAADIIKRAMIDTDRLLLERYPRARMIMQVHDELVIEAPTPEAKEIAEAVAHIMSRGHGLDVYLKVEYGIANNWDDAH
jgi:DNA polymerase-1